MFFLLSFYYLYPFLPPNLSSHLFFILSLFPFLYISFPSPSSLSLSSLYSFPSFTLLPFYPLSPLLSLPIFSSPPSFSSPPILLPPLSIFLHSFAPHTFILSFFHYFLFPHHSLTSPYTLSSLTYLYLYPFSISILLFFSPLHPFLISLPFHFLHFSPFISLSPTFIYPLPLYLLPCFLLLLFLILFFIYSSSTFFTSHSPNFLFILLSLLLPYYYTSSFPYYFLTLIP